MFLSVHLGTLVSQPPVFSGVTDVAHLCTFYMFWVLFGQGSNLKNAMVAALVFWMVVVGVQRLGADEGGLWENPQALVVWWKRSQATQTTGEISEAAQ